MEYIHTVLAQIPAGRTDEITRPGGILSAIDDHRSYLEQQPGFLDVRVTRSINREGQVQIVVESRWADEDTLVRYETSEPNVLGIINSFSDVIIADSVQVLDMEALRSEPRSVTARELTERMAIPLLIPAGVLAFALLVIYGLSRVYLEIPSDFATPLAAGIAAGIFLVAWFIASNPRVTGFHVVSIAALAGAVLLGGTLFAVIRDDGDEAEAGTPEPTVSVTATPNGGATGPTITMGDNFFEFEGKRNPTITVSAGQEVTYGLINKGQSVHNMRIEAQDRKYDTADDVVSDPDFFRKNDTGTIAWELPAGTYNFRCDFHAAQMVGKITVQ